MNLITVVILISLLGIGLFFWFRRPADKVLPAPEEKPQLKPEKSISSGPRFSKAIQSWIPLLKSDSKDRSKWEEALIMSDMGPKLTDQLLTGLEASSESPQNYLHHKLLDLIQDAEKTDEPWTDKKPWVLMMMGVNGVGKTTTLVKLAHYFLTRGLSVGVVGADTFRKGAIEQLERGVQKVGAEFFSMKVGEEFSEGADPSAVIFDGLRRFNSKDIILVDTSGRLHHKTNLMEELKKMTRVADKAMPGAPHEKWLILDATLGQNGLAQALSFHQAAGLTGLVLTKMDGLSRGGMIFQCFQELKTPIRFMGVGERPEDLETFSAKNFVKELFDLEARSS